MPIKIIVVLVLFFGASLPVTAQSQWTRHVLSTTDEIQGRIGLHEDADFGRLPAELETAVRPAVWHLGRNAAGLYVDFKTNADSIHVYYQVNGAIQMPHMPATGVSGLDLYAYDEEAKVWNWAHGSYSFKDTISYKFDRIGSEKKLTYRLYLPLYNSVEWMEIAVSNGETIDIVKEETSPLVIYGTSIAQGACASRPGLAWTNLLGRAIDIPVVNLAFSGNGRLEEPLLKLIRGEQPQLIVLDCLPNLTVTDPASEERLDSLVRHAVYNFRKTMPDVPIILTEHSGGFNPSILNETSGAASERTTLVARKAVQQLKDEGVENLYVLPNSTIGLDVESTVDYVHPNDIGMQKIADAYSTLIKQILKP